METPEFEIERERETAEEEYEPLNLETIERLERAENEVEVKEILPKFFAFLEREVGAEVTADIDSVYQEIEKQHELVRLENIRHVAESLGLHRPLKIGSGEDHYANVVVPDNEGIRIALAEGEAPRPLRLLIGFDVKTAIGFSSEGLRVHDIDQSEFDLRDTALRASLCRHVEGELPPEQIHHIITRVPRQLMPEELLTAQEEKSESRYIFRGARLAAERLPLSLQESTSLQRDLIKESGLLSADWIQKHAAQFRKEVTQDAKLRALIREDRKQALAEVGHRLETYREKAA
ncbi:MAG: hypothetical protein HY378_00240 [Candidatus Brennerbacteria bacterium]|nr:hypothetical protein [Candidatus Brennerbacteria bacterium]